MQLAGVPAHKAKRRVPRWVGFIALNKSKKGQRTLFRIVLNYWKSANLESFY